MSGEEITLDHILAAEFIQKAFRRFLEFRRVEGEIGKPGHGNKETRASRGGGGGLSSGRDGHGENNTHSFEGTGVGGGRRGEGGGGGGTRGRRIPYGSATEDMVPVSSTTATGTMVRDGGVRMSRGSSVGGATRTGGGNGRGVDVESGSKFEQEVERSRTRAGAEPAATPTGSADVDHNSKGVEGGGRQGVKRRSTRQRGTGRRSTKGNGAGVATEGVASGDDDESIPPPPLSSPTSPPSARGQHRVKPFGSTSSPVVTGPAGPPSSGVFVQGGRPQDPQGGGVGRRTTAGVMEWAENGHLMSGGSSGGGGPLSDGGDLRSPGSRSGASVTSEPLASGRLEQIEVARPLSADLAGDRGAGGRGPPPEMEGPASGPRSPPPLDL